MFENETQEEYLARWAVYKNFLDFWNSIPITWHDDHDSQKKFMFDFLLRLITSCWEDFNFEQQQAIKSKSRSYLNCSDDEVVDMVKSFKDALSSFSLNEELSDIESKDIVQLLEELIECDDVCTEYTFDEGVSLTPFYISYPPSYAFQILKHMGYEKKDG